MYSRLRIFLFSSQKLSYRPLLPLLYYLGHLTIHLLDIFQVIWQKYIQKWQSFSHSVVEMGFSHSGWVWISFTKCGHSEFKTSATGSIQLQFCHLLPRAFRVCQAIASLAELTGGMAEFCQQHYLLTSKNQMDLAKSNPPKWAQAGPKREEVK